MSTIIYGLALIASILVAIWYVLYSKRLKKQIELQDNLIDEMHAKYNALSDKYVDICNDLVNYYEPKKEEP